MKLLKNNSIPLRVLACCTVLLLSLGTSHATHIVGGEMNYKCLGNNQYEIVMTVFRDCENGIPNFDDPASIGFFDENDNLISTVAIMGVLDINYIEDDTLDPTLFDSCLVVPPNVCVDRTTYVDTVSLPFISGGYNVVYQRCCRNYSILNIVDPESTGATYGIQITEQAMLECNSNAVFKKWPPNYICVNEPILFDHSALDAEGDSLVYKLCAPFHGAERDACVQPNQIVPCHDVLQPCGPRPCPPFNPPFNDVVWIAPYSIDDMMGGVPLAIDPVTGLLTGTPNTIGQFVVGICVEEYRDGALISETKRDFQYNVGQCGEAISAFFAPAVDCDGFTVNFDNQSQDAVDFTWDFGDPTTTADVSTETNPSYTYPDTGLYVIEMIAGPNETCADTSYSSVSVQIPSLFVDFELTGLVDGCVYPAQVSFSDLSYDTISTIVEWDWQFSNGDSSDVEDPVWYVTENGTYTATLTVTAANGCQVSHSASIPISVLELGLQDTATICIGNSAILNPGTDPSYTYNWSPGLTLNSVTSPSPTATPSDNTTYYVTVEDSEGCIYTDSVKVVIEDLVINFDNEIDFCLGDTVVLHNGAEPNLSYSWFPNTNLIDGLSGTASAYPEEETVYYVNVLDNVSGCQYLDSIRLIPIIDEELPDTFAICEGESVNLNPNPNTSYSYNWLPATGLDDATSANPVATPSETTTYTVELLELVSSCIYEQQVTVAVNPLPSLTNNNLDVCLFQEQALNPGANADFDYTWSPATNLDNPNAPNPNITATVDGNATYYVTIVNPITQCEHVDSIEVFVPTAITVQASDDDVICEASLDISATSNTATSYDWYANPELTDLIGSGQTIEVSPDVNSTYFVVATDAYGCTSLDEVQVGSQSVNVEVPAQITACEENGFSVEAINLNPDDVLTYEWLPDTYVVDGAGTSNPTFLLEENGILTLVVENQYGCLDTLLIPVDVIENELDIIATADPDSIYPGESSQLNVTQAGDFIYEWTMGDVLDNDMIANPLATPLVTTTFDVFVEDVLGCKDTSAVTVFLRTFICDEPYIFVPNAFTPDNDGMNDIFYVRGNAVDEVFMAVYNRWGEKVFETNNLDTGWDGSYKGKELAPDVYGYYLQVKCLNGEEYFKKGNVTLIR